MSATQKGMQLIPYPLKSPTFSVGGVDTIPLDVLPKTWAGRIAHLAAISFDCKVTATISSGTATVYGLNNIVEGLDLYDGFGFRFQGNFNNLRWKEMLEAGKPILPDPDNAATTEATQFMRWLSLGPSNYAGDPSDFIFPCAALENAEIRFRFLSALTRHSANTSAIAVQITPIAWLAVLDGEVRIPPAHEFVQYTLGSSDTTINGRSLYTTLATVASLTTPGTAIAAGDFASFQIDTGSGSVNTVPVSSLTKGFHALKESSSLSSIAGEPGSAVDDNAKRVDGATPTAMTGADAVLQPVLYSNNAGSRISKALYMAESGLRVKWTGTRTSAGALVGRIVAQPASAYAAIASKALANLGLASKGMKIKTLTKDDYTGPRGEFMPVAVKV